MDNSPRSASDVLLGVLGFVASVLTINNFISVSNLKTPQKATRDREKNLMDKTFNII